MVLIVCVDDHNGMMFNHRRQSQDRILRADILELTGGKKLWMNAYSRKQFAESDAEKILVDETFLDAAGDGEFCFVENADVSGCAERIEEIYLYHWNRIFPRENYERAVYPLKYECMIGRMTLETVPIPIFQKYSGRLDIGTGGSMYGAFGGKADCDRKYGNRGE